MSYLILRMYYPNIPRQFNNPAPLFTVAYGFAVFTLSLLSVIVFVPQAGYCIASTAVLWVTFTAYYYFVSRSRQFFSEQEQNVLFVAYVIRGMPAPVTGAWLSSLLQQT
jgi:hypothetical protein